MVDAKESKGSALERRVARLEFAEGAVVAVRFPVREPQSDQAHAITDLDVVAIDIDQRLRTTLSIFECKSVRGQRAEADRLLALAGLKRYVGADRGILVRETATSRGRAIARRLGLELVDEQQLTHREQSHRWMPDAFGPVVGPRSTVVHSDVTKKLKSIGDFPFSLLDYLRYDALLDQPYRSIGALIRLREFRSAGTVLPRPVEGTIVSHALVALCLASIRTAGRLDSLGIEHARALIENGVMSGNPHDGSILRIASLADALMNDQLDRLHRKYTAAGAQRIQFEPPSIRETIGSTPEWLDRFMDLAVRMRARAAVARDIAQLAQLVCFDALMGDQHWTAPAFQHLFTIEHRQLLNLAIDLLRDILDSDLDVLAKVQKIEFANLNPEIADRSAAFQPSSKSDNDQSELFGL
jgi:hypothetical protein